MNFLLLALICGATARLTRLISQDDITYPLRHAFASWLSNENHKRGRRLVSTVEYMIVCTWCLSIWVGAAVAYTAHLYGTTWWFLGAAAALTGSLSTGLLVARRGS